MVKAHFEIVPYNALERFDPFRAHNDSQRQPMFDWALTIYHYSPQLRYLKLYLHKRNDYEKYHAKCCGAQENPSDR